MQHFARTTRATLLALLTFTVLATATYAAAGEPAFGLRPVRYDPARPATQRYFIYDAAPGQQVRDEVLVRNSGESAGVVRLYPVDGLTGDTSGAVFPEESTPAGAVGTWIALSEREFTLGPGEEKIIPFTVTIPAGARVGEHLGGIVAANTNVTQGVASGAVRINTQSRAVTAVQVNLPGPAVERVAVTGVTTGGRQGRQTVVLGLRNEGTAMVKPTGTVVLTDAQGREVQRLPFQLDTFLPGSAIQYPVAVRRQALGAGEYRARVELSYGSAGSTSHDDTLKITAAEVAQVFPSAAPLAAPVTATSAAAPVSGGAAQWPLIAGGIALVLLALVGGVALWRRGRTTGAAR